MSDSATKWLLRQPADPPHGWLMDSDLAKTDIATATRMRLLGEDKTYEREYELCLERIRARERVATKRAEARRLSSSTRSTA